MIYDLGPRAQRVYTALREQITTGAFPPATKLPPHTELAVTFGVAPLTVRHVLSRLEEEGLVSRQQGRGTFVRPQTPPVVPLPGGGPPAWLDQMADVAVAFDAHGGVRYWNASATALLGPAVDTGHGPRADHVYPAFMWRRWQSTAPTSPQAQDWRWQGPGCTGATVWLEGRLYPLHDTAGRLDGILCLGRNVTPYKQEEQTRLATSNALRPVSGLPELDLRVGVLVLGPQAVVLHSNPVACEFLGLPHEEIEGQSLAHLPVKIIYEDGTPLAKSGGPIAQALISGRPVHNTVLGVWRPRTADRVWVLLNADPEPAPDGGTTRVVCTAVDITQRRRALEAFQQRDREFKALVEHASDLIMRFDPHLRHIYVNPAAGTAFGLPPPALLNKTPAEVETLAGAAVPIQAALTRVLNTGEEVVTEITLPTGRQYQARLTPEFGPDGSITSVLSIARDITAQRVAQEALRRSEERFTKAFRASPDTIAILRLADGHLVDVNESWLRAFGYRRDEVVGRIVPGLALAENLAERERIVRLLREYGAVRDYEVVSRRKNGEARQFSLSVELIDLAGEEALLVMGRDVTERKRAWAAQRRSEERFARVFRSSPIAIAISRLSDTVLLEANDTWLTMMGCRWEEAVGHSTLELGLWTDMAERAQVIADLRDQGTVHERELIYRHQSGESRLGLFSFELLEVEGEMCLLTMARDITARKQAEAALRLSEERFAKTFQASPMGIGLSRLSDGTIIDVNESWTQLTGYTREEAIGQRGMTLNLWATSADRARVIGPLQEQRRVREVETSFRRKTGQIYQASVSADVIEISGEPCVLMLSRDITAQKQAQDALRRSEERFARVFHASPVGIAISRLADGVFIEVNETWLTMSGYRREEVVGQSGTALGLWSTPQDRERLLTTVRDQGAIRLQETRYRRRSGEVRDSLMSFEMIEIDGEPCLLGTIQDITERKQAEQAHRRSEERFAKMFHSSPDAISLSRLADGLLLDVNESWTRLFGYTREETVGRTSETLDLWTDPREQIEPMALLQGAGGVLDYPVLFRRRSGESVRCSVSLEKVEIEGETCVLAMIRDITERQQIEERARAAERLAALGRVAAGVAHEFNNVLTGIMGRLDLLALEIHDPGPATHLRLIQQAAEDGATVVARIGRFARVQDTGERTALGVQDLVNDVITLTEPRRRSLPGQADPPINIYTDIAPHLRVRGNPTELREVLTNLIFNAADAMPHGGQIRISGAEQGDRARIVVEDDGTGIDPAIQPRIFEPFFTTKGTGSGLGLAMVKNIMEGHGGEIGVTSEPGRGTCFVLTLPAAPAPAALPPAARLPAGGHPARILAVDDDRRLGDLLQAMLRLGGHEVLVAGSGPEALELLDQRSFDLVCTDLGMPGMSGWEVAAEVHRRAPGTRIALITGWGNQLDPAELARHGVDFVLAKPYRAAQVQDLVIQALGRPVETRMASHAGPSGAMVAPQESEGDVAPVAPR
jgi:PAS domain S-box-containing protein